MPYEQAYQEGYEDMRGRVPDITKIESLTGWRPQHTLQDILTDTVGTLEKELTRCTDADATGKESGLVASSPTL